MCEQPLVDHTYYATSKPYYKVTVLKVYRDSDWNTQVKFQISHDQYSLLGNVYATGTCSASAFWGYFQLEKPEASNEHGCW